MGGSLPEASAGDQSFESTITKQLEIPVPTERLLGTTEMLFSRLGGISFPELDAPEVQSRHRCSGWHQKPKKN